MVAGTCGDNQVVRRTKEAELLNPLHQDTATLDVGIHVVHNKRAWYQSTIIVATQIQVYKYRCVYYVVLVRGADPGQRRRTPCATWCPLPHFPILTECILIGLTGLSPTSTLVLPAPLNKYYYYDPNYFKTRMINPSQSKIVPKRDPDILLTETVLML
eukprot:COSAG05_NODE_5119_length_1259_cov_1.492241_3_plen_158_part_00